MHKKALIIFTKNPELGKVKTRLAASIGNQKALNVYLMLLQHTFNIAKDVDAHIYVFYSDKIILHDLWEDLKPEKVLQHGNDLGEKMNHAFEFVLNKGYEKVILIGTDVFMQTTQNIEIAFELLEHNDTVINPVEDGGYCLIGLKKIFSNLFLNKTWSHSNVFNEALLEIKKQSKTVALLPKLVDIDTITDLEKSNFFI